MPDTLIIQNTQDETVATAKLAKTLKVGENVVVNYKTLSSGENEAVYVQRVIKAAPKK